MFKLEKTKLVISASAVSLAALFAAGCMGGAAPSEVEYPKAADIGGGVIYPIQNGMTGPYYVNEKALANSVYQGRVPTENELKAWDVDIQAGGKGLPEGSGTVAEGEELYEAKCVMCHGDFGSGGGGYPALSKGNAYELQKTLTNNRWKDPEAEGPTRVFGSYWPEASTMWWYIRDGMPHPKSKTLSADETYALTAYMLSINELKVGDVLVSDDDEFELNQDNFKDIVMPNRDGFEPDVRGPNALERVRAYFAVPENFGAIKVAEDERCMTNCQQTDRIARVQNGGIDDFHPPMSVERSLPKVEKKAIDPVKVYAANCAMCHDSYLAPGSAEWAGYTGKGMDKVLANAIKGTPGGMPARGGSSLDDEDMKTMVDYIVSGKVK
jgi:cytochrome c